MNVSFELRAPGLHDAAKLYAALASRDPNTALSRVLTAAQGGPLES
jgi:hypothetical protein